MSSATLSAVPTAPPAPGPLQATVDRDELLQALSWAAQAVPRRAQSAVLGGAHLACRAGGLDVTGFDHTLRATQTVSAPGGNGAALAPARTVLDLVRTLPAGSEVQLRASKPAAKHEGVLTLTAGSPGGLVTFHVPLLPLHDYPQIDDVCGPNQLLTGPDLAHLTRATAAAGRDDTMPILTCAHLAVGPSGRPAAACTDRYRLAVAELPDGTAWKLGALAVPTGALSAASSAFGKAQQVLLTAGDRGPNPAETAWLQVQSGSRLMDIRLDNPDIFPKYRSLLPDSTPTALAVDRDALLTAVTQAAAAGARHSPVQLALTDGDLTVRGGISHGSPDGVAATAQVPGATLTGPGLNIAFNPDYLKAGLRALPAGTVTFALTATTRPTVLSSTDLPHFRYLLMPVRMAG